jgi:serine/threonine protein kinase
MASSSTDVFHRAQRRVGAVLNGKWHLDEVLGVGGMASVYAATHRNQKRVAIKMLHPELSFDDNVRGRFLREGYAANTVGHPGAVTVFDDDVTEDGAAFLVMELLEGETAHARLQREGVFALEDALPLGEEVLDVLVSAHDKGIVHRDLKPENIFLTETGRVRLLDFGIARLRELPMGTGISANGLFMGTPAFMSPEHARGRWSEVDAQSDIWSVGATLYTLLTGKFVHESESAVDTLVLAVTQAPRPIRSMASRVPESVAVVIDRALFYNKEDRWDSARTMQVALRSARLSLAPDELVLRGGQRDQPPERSPSSPSAPAPERSPSSPRAHVNATVRSAPPFSPRTEDARRLAAAGDSLEPLDSTHEPGSTLPVLRRPTRRPGWLLLGIAVATLIAIGIAIFGHTSGPQNAVAPLPGDSPQVLLPSSEPAPAPSPVVTAAPLSIEAAAAATAAASAGSATLPTAAPRQPRHDHHAAAPPLKSSSVLAPSAMPTDTTKPSNRDNPFDRRF